MPVSDELARIAHRLFDWCDLSGIWSEVTRQVVPYTGMIERCARFSLSELFLSSLVVDFPGFCAARDVAGPQRLLIKWYGLSEGLSR